MNFFFVLFKISTQRFFIEEGIDIHKQEISVVGIGSMSGDVFGNGMMESEKFKLLAAISQREIFIDPNPDIKKAYAERKRLFESKNGGWDNWKMIQIASREQITKRDAERIEEEYRLELKAELNDKRAYRDKQSKEYKEKKGISDKKYRESEKGKANCESRKDYFTEYNNNQETKDRKHEWYLANKEKQLAKQAERYVCSCGKEVTIGKKARHEKTQFHIDNCN